MKNKLTIKAVKATDGCKGCVFTKLICCGYIMDMMYYNGVQYCDNGFIYIIDKEK